MFYLQKSEVQKHEIALTLLLKCTILFYLVYTIIKHKYYMCCFFLPVALARANLLVNTNTWWTGTKQVKDINK